MIAKEYVFLTKEVLYQLLLIPHSIPFKDSERSERQKELEVTVIQLKEKNHKEK